MSKFKLNLKRFSKSSIAYLMFWLTMIFLYIVGFMFLSSSAKGQDFDNYKKIVVTQSDLMDGIFWSIGNCDLDTVIFNGTTTLDQIVYLPKKYRVLMRDFDGNAWGGAVMHIINYPDLDSALTLNYFNESASVVVHDCGCTDSTYFEENLQTFEMSIEEINSKSFTPTIYYDMMGRRVKPTKGLYIASDGILRKKIYIDEIN
tara:strand:- start:433 stop:1038 length:606 start_codon:yes stop_codon:yes gene_type:complete